MNQQPSSALKVVVEKQQDPPRKKFRPTFVSSSCITEVINPRLFKLREDSKGKGATMVAKQDLSPGQKIIVELPIVCGPGDDLELENQGGSCLGCCASLHKKKNKRCSKCGWPCCGILCENTKQHAENECKYFQERKIQYPLSIDSFRLKYFLYKGIMVLRALLLKQKYPQKFKEFLSLSSNRNSDPEIQKHAKTHDTVLLKLLRETFHIPDSFLSPVFDDARKELGELLDHMAIYGFATIPSYSYSRQVKRTTVVNSIYHYASKLSRSCLPNTTWTVGAAPDFALTIVAAKTIYKNEELALSYTMDLYKYGTLGRQLHVNNVLGHGCLCRRCVDPTEAGTYFSAIKCSECDKGYLVPHNPSSIKSTWQCLNDDCQTRVRSGKIIDRVAEICAKSDDIIKSSKYFGGTDAMEEYLQELKHEGYLHPNHFLVYGLAWEIVNRQFEELHFLDTSALDSFLLHCEYLLNIENVISPGYTHGRGLLYFYMARAFFKLYDVLEGRFSPDEALSILDNIMTLYDEARKIFRTVNKQSKAVVAVLEDMKTIVTMINVLKNCV